MKKIGLGRFESFSAGSHPRGEVHPLALRALEHMKVDPQGARSKSWDEFKGTEFDFVITVCDRAKESCPVWPGQPIAAHWGFKDPANEEIDEKIRWILFNKVAAEMSRRLELLMCLPMEKMDRLRLAEATQSIHEEAGGETKA